MNDEYLTNEIGPEIKRVTLHPLDADGNPDTEVNLYPKTLLDGIVDREGNEVEVALKEDLPTSDDFVTLGTDQVIGGYKRFSSTLRVGDEIMPQILIDGNSSNIDIFRDTMNYITYDVEGIHGCINEGSQNCNLTFPKKTGVLATTSDIPTNYVTIDTNQIITGNKSLAPNTQVIFDSEHKKHLISNNNGDISIVRVDNSGNYHGVLHISSGGEFHEGKETITIYGDLVRYEDNSTATIGDIIKPFKNIYLNGKINENYSGYGLKVPQTWDWNEDKEIATTDQLPTNYVTTDSDQVIFGNKTFNGQTDFISQVNIWGDTHITTIKNGDGNYGLLVPGTTSYTANKTIATTEDCGTKLYHHHLASDLVNWVDVILYDNIELTDREHYNDWLYLGKQILSGSGYNDNETATIYSIYCIQPGETLVVKDITGTEHYFSDLVDTVTPL